jgi:hypothetical protein
MLGKDGAFVKQIKANREILMKPLTQQLLLGIAGCLALTLIFGYGISIAVNYGISKFEDRAGDFLPGVPNTQTAPNANP